MANRILQNDAEEYDAKQEPVKVPTKEEGIKTQAAKYKEEINNIEDEKLLTYIMDCCSAKLSSIRAEERLTEKEEKPKTLPGMNS